LPAFIYTTEDKQRERQEQFVAKLNKRTTDTNVKPFQEMAANIMFFGAPLN